MGQSTDAILFWGFHADEGEWDEFIGDEEGDSNWEAAYAAKKGEPAPAVEYDTEENKALHSAHWEREHKLIAAEPCEVDSHCSGDCPMPFVCVKASKTTAWRGDPKEIASLAVGPTWESELRGFCALMGIPWQEPKWWLASDWN
jgi:hypothetical protein